MKQNYKLILTLTIIIILTIGVAAAITTVTLKEKQPKKITATVSIYFGNGTIWTYKNITTTNATVFGLLMEAASKGNFTVKSTYYGQYDSILIDSIASVKNGENNKYWQYYINGNYGTIGADKQPVNNGDIIEWKFEEFG